MGKIPVIINLVLFFVRIESQQLQFSIQQVLPSACGTPQYFDFGTLQCGTCGTNMDTDSTGLSCKCSDGYKADINNVRVLTCSQCPGGTTTPDGYYCATCSDADVVNGQCICDTNQQLIIDEYSNITIAQCTNCSASNLHNTGNLNCVPCPECCDLVSGSTFGDLCFTDATIIAELGQISTSPDDSIYIIDNIKAAYGACISDLTLRNQTACEQLANMCVMETYSQDETACQQYQTANGGEFITADGAAWQTSGLPWLYYSTTSNSLILNDETISTTFSFDGSSNLDFVVARYRANGTYLGMTSVRNGLIQLCQDKLTVMNAAYAFGTTFQSSCTLDVTSLFNDENRANTYYDMFLRYTSNSQTFLYPIPVLVTNYVSGNTGSNSNNWELARRFFLIDNIFGATGGVSTVWYARSMEIQIRLQPSSASGKIYPPILRMSYESVDSTVLEQSAPTVQTSFSVSYSSSTADQNEGIKISMSILGVLAFLFAAIETSGWRRRQGLPYIELTTLIQFLLFFMGNVANVFFVVILGYTTVLLIFFKGQNSVTSYVPSNDSYQSYLFMIFLATAFACKLLQVLVMIFQQSLIDIFLIDWERPRAKDGNAKVSVWRTYFIANEWNEIQTCRKINTTFQLFTVLLFLEVFGFKNLATLSSSNDLNPPGDNYEPASSNLLRFSVGGLVYVIVALVQVIYFKFIHGRFIGDKIRDFIDLCSVSNVSVFVLAQNTFGYYIHGRSVHGRADTDMAEMSQMLIKEGEGLAPKRGLMTETEEQVFEISIPVKMRQQYDKVYQPLQLMRNQPAGRGGGTRGDTVVAENMKAHNTMKTFLTAFLDHSLRDLDYVTKDKVFLEKVLGIEFQEPIDRAFFRTVDEDAFADILFYGREIALLVFDILLFSLVDYGSMNFILAAIITYIVGGVFKVFRNQLGKFNLAKKTLIDKRFLI